MFILWFPRALPQQKCSFLEMLIKGNVGVIGFGVSGRYITHALIKLGLKPIVFEKKSFVEGEDEVRKLKDKAVFVFGYKKDDLKKADILILSSGVKPDDFSEFNFISEIDFVCSFLKEYIFITGTKGKGTTLLFTGALFNKAEIDHFLGGNIGEGDLYSPSAKAIDFPEKLSILEVSSFQLKSTKYASPLIHAITNLDVDHLDWHKDLEDYWDSKTKICEKADICIIPPEIEHLVKERKVKNVFLVGKDIVLQNDSIVYGNKKFYFDQKRFLEKFPGKHNIKNLLMAFSIFLKYTELKKIDFPDDILEIYDLVPKRKYILEFEGKYNLIINGVAKEVSFFNDSMSTNPISLRSAIESFDNPEKIVLICGGLAKGFDFSSIEDNLKKIKFAILIGSSAKIISKSFKDKIYCQTLEEAIQKSIELSDNGDIVLFSPGCASFDMFSSAKERGQIFSEKLKKIIKMNENKKSYFLERAE